MKLKMKNDRGLVFEAVNPDQHLQQYYQDRIAEAYRQELVNFLQETVATLRKLKPGEKVTIYSKPIEVTLEHCETEQSESNASLSGAAPFAASDSKRELDDDDRR